jgi:hypothetical protein
MFQDREDMMVYIDPKIIEITMNGQLSIIILFKKFHKNMCLYIDDACRGVDSRSA